MTSSSKMTMVSKAERERKVSKGIPGRNEQHKSRVFGNFLQTWEIIGRFPLGQNTVFWKRREKLRLEKQVKSVLYKLVYDVAVASQQGL